MKETYVPLLHLFEALAFCFAIKSWPMCSGWSKGQSLLLACVKAKGYGGWHIGSGVKVELSKEKIKELYE